MKKLRVLDLFAGIGMFSYGLHRTGLYETTAFCEWDLACQRVLEKRFPDVGCTFGDIKEVWGQPNTVGHTYDKTPGYELSITRGVDIITGGFPCQDISNSGTKEGLSGSRSSHWFHFLRLIKDIKPRGVIIENVSALAKRGMGEVLQGLSEIGYDAEWHIIPAAYCGAVHKRSRLFVLAYPTRFGQQEPWRPLEPFNKTETRNRETNIIKYALQRKSLPYVCGDHPKCTNGVDRLKQLGNTVYWPIVEQLGYHVHKNVVSQ